MSGRAEAYSYSDTADGGTSTDETSDENSDIGQEDNDVFDLMERLELHMKRVAAGAIKRLKSASTWLPLRFSAVTA